MVHMPKAEHWQEMLAVPHLVRLAFPMQNAEGRFPTLLIKAHSLLLKYIFRGAEMELRFFCTPDGYAAYALHIQDDPEHGVTMWSILADDDEKFALSALKENPACSVYLFNEACAGCAWTTASIRFEADLQDILSAREMRDRNPVNHISVVEQMLEEFSLAKSSGFIAASVVPQAEWKLLKCSFILDDAHVTSLNLLDDKEGDHQEELAHTLMGALSFHGAYANTRKGPTKRSDEFTDILLTHDFGTAFVESKALHVLTDDVPLPDRKTTSKRTSRLARKAVEQLETATDWWSQGKEIYSFSRELLTFERPAEPHCIVLVSEIELLSASGGEWFEKTVKFQQESRGFLHFMDTLQLFRAVQAAEMIANAHNIPKTAAFEYYLMQRIERVFQKRSIHVELLVQIQK